MPIVSTIAKDGRTITITFENVADGLEMRGDLKQWLNLTTNGQTLDYDYKLQNDTLVLTGDFEQKVKISYCEDNYVEAVLFNSEDNPVFGFEREV